MSTQVTVSVAAPNHLPITVYVQSATTNAGKPGWADDHDTKVLQVGEARTFLVHSAQRLVIEEMPD